nr:hypothetical protein [Tanacetum cinerariifolium]
ETTPIMQYTQRYRIAQSSVLPPAADEPVSPLRDVSQREAFPTDSGFIVDQDRATIAKSSTLPHDSAPRVTSPAADEGTQEVEINRLKERVKQLEVREGVAATISGDDASIKGRSMDEGEATTERVSDDIEEMATVLTSMDAATVLAKSETPKKQKVQEQIDAQVARELEEQLAREDQRIAEQIARDAEIARIHDEEELQSMVDGLDNNNETVAKYLEEYPSYQFFTDLLKHLDRDDLNQLWSLVKETVSKRPATSDKEMELWVELSRLYEPNVED